MSETITVTTLVENTVNLGGLQAEHGLAFLIRAGGRRFLFDTGQTDLLVRNARQMGLPLEGLSGIALSHGHYDHTGGLAAVTSPRTRIFLHPAAAQPKFALEADGKTRSNWDEARKSGGCPKSRNSVALNRLDCEAHRGDGRHLGHR